MTEQQRRQLVIVACWWAGILFALLWFRFPYVRGLFQQPPPLIYSLYAIAVVYVALRTATVFALPIIATRTQHTAFNWLGSDHWLVLPDMFLLTLGVHFTGGIQSDLYLAFFVPIVACGLAYRVRFTLLIAFAAAVLHLIATWHDRFERTIGSMLRPELSFSPSSVGSSVSSPEARREGVRGKMP